MCMDGFYGLWLNVIHISTTLILGAVTQLYLMQRRQVNVARYGPWKKRSAWILLICQEPIGPGSLLESNLHAYVYSFIFPCFVR